MPDSGLVPPSSDDSSERNPPLGTDFPPHGVLGQLPSADGAHMRVGNLHELLEVAPQLRGHAMHREIIGKMSRSLPRAKAFPNDEVIVSAVADQAHVVNAVHADIGMLHRLVKQHFDPSAAVDRADQPSAHIGVLRQQFPWHLIPGTIAGPIQQPRGPVIAATDDHFPRPRLPQFSILAVDHPGGHRPASFLLDHDLIHLAPGNDPHPLPFRDGHIGHQGSALGVVLAHSPVAIPAARTIQLGLAGFVNVVPQPQSHFSELLLPRRSYPLRLRVRVPHLAQLG